MGTKPKIHVLQDRQVERGRGCWNCIHSSHERAQDLWWNKAREAILAKGLKISLESKTGESDPRVMNIKKMVVDLDKGITEGAFLVCVPGYGDADFEAATYLCDKWTGKQGSSLATAGHKLDDLPGELMDKRGDGNEASHAIDPKALAQGKKGEGSN